MLVLLLVLLAIVAFGLRFVISDGRLTAGGGILLALAWIVSSGAVTP